MNLADQLTLVEIFEQKAADKRRKERLLWEENEHAFEERNRQKLREEEEKKLLEEFLATDRQIAAFRDELDNYDTAVVHALMDNERALEEARKRREDLESSAYRLPDGRMAFKTEDGKRVFDRNGVELSRDTVDPDSIPDSRPRWEALKGIVEEEKKLSQDRQELHEFQKKIDDARDAIGKPGVSAKELEELGADLKRDMPEAIRLSLSDNARAQDPPAPDVVSGPAEAPRTGHAAKIFSP